MTRHNSSEKVLGYFLVKHSIDFLMASCTFGQVGKWLKVAFGIVWPYPMPCFFFFFFWSPFSSPLSSWAVTGLSSFHIETKHSQACLSGQRPRYQTFPSQYVLVHTLFPKGFAYQFSVDLVKNQCWTVLYVLVTV